MKRKLPLWAMGLSFAPMGFYYGFVSTALPILLAGRGVSVAEATAVQATAFSPTFWGFALSPILEIWLSRKQWSVLCVMITAACLCGAVMSIGNLALLTALLLTGCVSIVLFGGALGAWLSEIADEESLNHLSAWTIVANLGAAGIFATLAVVLIRKTPLWVATGIPVTLLLLPMLLLFFFPDEAAKARTVRQVFGKFWQDLKLVWGRRTVALGMLAFLLPESCFALSNSFGLLGKDFHVPESWVTGITGGAVAVLCSLGSLLGVPLCNRYSRRRMYLVTGISGAIFTAALIFTPHTLTTFAAGVLGYSFIQGINYTAFAAWQFELVGHNNPQGAIQFAAIAAAANLPITYMTAVEGRGYGRWGLNGMLGIDAATSVVLGLLLLMVFSAIDRRMRARSAAAA